MAEQLWKLSPDRDLQCYFLQPSAIAAMSGASASGFTLSGSWRQQWDWAVVEWNRDNVFEHPTLRPLPDGDLSGLTLSYVEQRNGCVPLESNLYPTVEWPYLRVWTPNGNGGDDIYFVRLSEYAAPASGSSYTNASATMTLAGTVTPGLRVGLAFMGTFASPAGASGAPIEQHYYYVPQAADTLAAAASGLANAINAGSGDIQATANGASIVCVYRGSGALRDKTGANGNRVGVYGYAQQGSQTAWQQGAALFSGGAFPSQYTVTLPLGNLRGVKNDPTQFFAATVPYVPVPMTAARKLRWTWSADLQIAAFVRSEFSVNVTNWNVTGTGRQYFVAGPGSRRLEEDHFAVTFSGPHGTSDWAVEPPGNFSGSRVQVTSQIGASCTITYSETAAHKLLLGTRMNAYGPNISVSIDGGAPVTYNLMLRGEDQLVRLPLGSLAAGSHTVRVVHAGPAADVANNIYYPLVFDFLEIAYPAANLPDVTAQPQLALATDWDTLHSQALPAERTAWLIWKLGFHGRVNHYTGAIWFYELVRPGQQYANVTATISVPAGSPTGYTEIDFGSGVSVTPIQHLNLPDDTAATIAAALAQRINQGTTAIWASAAGSVLTITARTMGTEGNGLPVSAYTAAGNVTVTLSGGALAGGVDGTNVGFDLSDPNAKALNDLTNYWRTDLNFNLGLNRACRDWSQKFFQALAGYGIDCVATFSTELAHVDPTPGAGMAQRYPDGSPVVLNTPGIQTNFSPSSLAFWQRVYTTMAALQQQAGLVPYLQSGEVQWWYFPKAGAGMTFYDAYTQQQFTAAFGGSMAVITDNNTDPAQHPNEAQFLRSMLGNFTAGLRTALRAGYASARYEVLYPGDVNAPRFNAAINFPSSDWTPANLNCLKTESFTYTNNRDLDASVRTMAISASAGFGPSQRSHLVGIADAKTSWMKEVDLAQADGMESVVLFALDQYCLIGYPAPPFVQQRWSRRAA